MNDGRLSIGGAVSMFRIAKSTSLAEVKGKLENLDLGKYTPEPRSEQSCLKAALGDVYRPEDPKAEKYVLRPIKNGVKGFAVVCERPGDEKSAGDDWGEVVATVGFDSEDNLTMDPFHSEKRDAIRGGMDGARKWLTAASVGKALVELAEHVCHAVSLRPTGGVYWVLDSYLPQWEEIARVFETSCAHKDERGKDATPTSVYVLRVVADEQMVRAVGDALTSEVEQALANIEVDIREAELKEQACLSRLRRVGELSDKVKRYEESFKRPLTSLADAVQRSATAVAQATIQASAAAQSEHRLATAGV